MCSFCMCYTVILAEVTLIEQSAEEQKAEEKRKKTVIVGDMQPLASALPMLSTRCGNME